MIAQILQDSKGNETGVFIPIDEWNRMKEDYPGLAHEVESNQSNGFEFTSEHFKILEKSMAEPAENCISEVEMMKQLREKNAAVQT